VAKLQAEVKRSQNSPKAINSLGVLYARYALYDKAEAQFAGAIAGVKAGVEYTPALINLGNIYYIKKELDKAQDCFERVHKREAGNSLAELGLARINHDLENYGETKKYFDELRKSNPSLAEKFAYLDLEGGDATKAADISKEAEAAIWSE
jgi:tetratricopeptide (TPR) repeat protein